jgi:hypothetical protein
MSIEQCLQHTGCVLEEPSIKDYDYELIAGSTGVVAPVKAKAKVIYNQGDIDSCVGMAVAGQETVQNGIVVSPRIVWAGAKEQDNFQGWGTTIKKGFESLINKKTLPFGDIDESVAIPRDEYMRVTLTDAQKKKAESYSISSYWTIINREANVPLIYDALKNGNALVTSMMWHSSYNRPVKGFLPQPDTSVGGHAFILDELRIINGELCGVFANSFGPSWGEKGYFYIPVREFMSRGLGQFWVSVDIESNTAKILNRYQTKLIKNANSPKVYYVKGNAITWIRNERAFFWGRDDMKVWGNWADVLTIDTPIVETETLFIE